MNILFVTGHPAQIHGFRTLKFELEKKGHKVFWLATNKEISNKLLNYYRIEYGLLRRPGRFWISKAITLVNNLIISIRYIKKSRIEIVFSRISPYVCLACFLLRKVHFGLTDTESAGFYDKFFSCFLSVLFTGKSFRLQLRSDQIRFDGNIELFYLHPKRFTPLDKMTVAKLLGIGPEESYTIMRFVSWDAYHDKGLSGFTNENKLKAVKLISNYSRVFISSEKPLPNNLEKYKIKIPIEKMHDALYHAKLFFGESATMASESAVLGTPAVFLDENGRGYIDEEANFGLVYNFKQNIDSQGRAIKKGVDLLQTNDIKSAMRINHNNYLKNKIDITAFMVWFVENYPDSKQIMEENPDYQYRFK